VQITFDEWRDEFAALMVQSGIPQRQVDKYYGVYESDVRSYYERGLSPGDACTKEILPFDV
jgi:hypothetical protein